MPGRVAECTRTRTRARTHARNIRVPRSIHTIHIRWMVSGSRVAVRGGAWALVHIDAHIIILAVVARACSVNRAAFL